VTPAGTDADKIKEVVAEGHVRIHKGDRLAEGRRAVFDQAKQTIVLSDGAVLHEGPNQVAGDRIVVYLQEERSVVEGGSNSRVSAVFYPGTHEAEAAATPPKAAIVPSAPATVQMGAADAPVAGDAR
jgi:lipopolysaccharide transport protein LptA